MKYILLLTVSTFATNLYSQNVGIGTKKPLSKLHVAGDIRIDSLAIMRKPGIVTHDSAGILRSIKLTGKKTDVLTGTGNFTELAAASDAWIINGNAGTNDVHFLGTTDKQPIRFRVNNLPAGEINILNGNIQFGLDSIREPWPSNDNIAIGNHALPYKNHIPQIAIGDSAMSQFNDVSELPIGNVSIGSRAMAHVQQGFANVAIGTQSMMNTIEYGSPVYNTAVGYGTLMSGGGGGATAIGAYALGSYQSNTFNTAVGSFALGHTVISYGNTAVGGSALLDNTSGIYNTGVGSQVLYLNETGSSNTAVGAEALFYAKSASKHTAIGFRASHNTTSGAANVAIGFETLFSNTTGTENVASGTSSLFSNRSGNYNTAFGNQSLFNNSSGSYNSGAGFKALFNNTNGNYNSASGFKSLNFNSTGSRNTAFGYESLNTNTSGSNNTALGYRADVSNNNLQNATAIGFEAKVNASNKIRLGNAAVTVIEGQVPFTTPSDARFKFNVRNDVKGLPFIMRLRPVSYQFNVNLFDHVTNGEQNNATLIRRTGFIAQEVEEAASKAGFDFSGIVRPASSDDHYGLSYETFVVPLVKAIQEQQQTIEQERDIIREHSQTINLLLKRIEVLEKIAKEK